ncbi:MAG TPA: PilZ domain-containing protein [Pyrinomonadaceae bacterium]|nr:PilZ domain-containing protein [Pyrinomonadaceae bacterium]
MSIEQRRHIRFSLDIPGVRYSKYNEAIETVLNQISIGGCLIEWEDDVYVGDEFRLLVELPNKNFLPLMCKVLYRFEDNGIGAKFLDITKFEQELITKIITQNLEQQGLPLQVDPFALPKKALQKETKISDNRQKREEILDNILSSND